MCPGAAAGAKNLLAGEKNSKGKVVTRSTNEGKAEGGEHQCEGMVYICLLRELLFTPLPDVLQRQLKLRYASE